MIESSKVGQDDVLLALAIVAAGYSPEAARRVIARVTPDFRNRPYNELISPESLSAFQTILVEEGTE